MTTPTDRRVNITLRFATDATTGDVLEAVIPAVNRAVGEGIALEGVTVHAFTLDNEDSSTLDDWTRRLATGRQINPSKR